MRATVIVVAGLLIGIAAGYGTATQAQATTAKLNMVVVCVKCIPEAMPQESYNAGNILLDQNTGNLWFYPGLIPGVKPVLLGTLSAPGQPIAKPATR